MALIFEWDVSFEEASTLFGDPLSLTKKTRFTRLKRNALSLLESQFSDVCWLLSTQNEEIVFVSSVRELLRLVKGEPMKKVTGIQPDTAMLDEYDFSEGVRGKYAERYAAGSNVVILSPDVAEISTDSKSVNEALRALIRIAQQKTKKVST